LIARPDAGCVLLVVDDPEPVLVVEVLLVPVCDCRVAVEVRSISEPRPRITPTNWVAVVLVPNTSLSDTLMEQSEFTL
jgi:hypothetical protein